MAQVDKQRSYVPRAEKAPELFQFKWVFQKIWRDDALQSSSFLSSLGPPKYCKAFEVEAGSFPLVLSTCRASST